MKLRDRTTHLLLAQLFRPESLVYRRIGGHEVYLSVFVFSRGTGRAVSRYPVFLSTGKLHERGVVHLRY